MLVVRAISPRLLGLGWLGAAFAAGGSGAALLFSAGRLPALFSVAAADVLVLSAFVLLHTAVLELLEVRRFTWFGLLLLAVQAAADLAHIYGGFSGRNRVVLAGLLIAIQAGRTALVLFGNARRGIKAPAYFSAALLLGLATVNLVRSLELLWGRLDDPATFYRVEGLTFLLFLAFAQGIAFGFFWMTTAKLMTNLDELASTDPLTRLYNRRVFMKWCERELERSRERESVFSILVLDLDHFKRVNDRFGHAAGDVALCAAVEQMQDSVRGIDVLGRWGGEEFVTLLPGATAAAAVLVAQRMRRNLEKTAIPLSRHGSTELELVNVTGSLGVATYLGGKDTIDLMLKRADAALYAAKAAGRNRVLVDAPAGPGLLPAHQS
jgi:diguanylate cyclase (GGDEF)-like protein